jgi:sigma-B regulation protein RsbU (phosphoserine phosphatase)
LPSSEVEVSTPPLAGSAALSLPPEAWQELLALAQDEVAERALLERLLDHWRAARGAACAALYLEREGRLEMELACSAPAMPDFAPSAAHPADPAEIGNAAYATSHAAHAGLPRALEAGVAAPAGMALMPFAGGCLLFAPRPPLPPDAATGDPGQERLEHGPLPLLLISSLKILRLRQEIKEHQFQVNYRVVELESLYDVGLAVAATLDLEKLSEEILLRAVSLLDARRGALYILEGDRYRLQRTFGGDAAPWLASVKSEAPENPEYPESPEYPEGPGNLENLDNAELHAFLAGTGAAPAELLPGAHYLLGVPIEVDGIPRGLLAVGDKESRRGVGPFPPSDRRTLSLFANQAAIALENARLHLEALEKERLEREMQLAAEIQRRILPRGAPEVPGYELLGWNRPARQIGGDYYDLFQRQDGRVGLVVGDVSGKGMPAALMVSTLHSALHLLLDQAGFGPALLEMLNRHILESSAANKFITLLLAELEPESGRVTYLNAGHNPGLLLRRDGAVEELGSSGLPIGVLPGSRFLARTVTLAPGDLLCIYSDGITEAESPAEEEFGTARLVALLREHRERPLPEVLEAIQVATGRFSAGLPQGDDQTLVLLSRRAISLP